MAGVLRSWRYLRAPEDPIMASELRNTARRSDGKSHRWRVYHQDRVGQVVSSSRFLLALKFPSRLGLNLVAGVIS